MKLFRNWHTRAIDHSNPHSLSSRFRIKRARLLLKLIEREAQRSGPVSIIDLGGERTYWNFLSAELQRQYEVSICIVNLPGHPRPADEECFKFVEGDACNLSSFTSGSFSIAHSNSVIEHVGTWGHMTAFAEEVRRLGRAYFVQTPNFWFPVEPHFMTPCFHWFPEPVRASLLMRFELGNWAKARSVADAMTVLQRANLLDRKMFSHLFPDGEIVAERFLGLTKSLIAIRA